MTIKEKLVRIKDMDTSENALFSGEEIIMFIDNISLTNNSKVQTSAKGFQDLSLASGENIQTNYNRRKSNITYKGFENPTINISGLISETAIGSDTITLDDGIYKLLTPIRLFQLVTSGKSFYLNDYILINNLKTLDTDNNRIYNDNGMPVAIQGFTMTPILGIGDEKGINYTIDFIEDKEI
ncbi:MAG: hypothetical protein ACOCUI_05100 [bacterium]